MVGNCSLCPTGNWARALPSAPTVASWTSEFTLFWKLTKALIQETAPCSLPVPPSCYSLFGSTWYSVLPAWWASTLWQCISHHFPPTVKSNVLVCFQEKKYFLFLTWPNFFVVVVCFVLFCVCVCVCVKEKKKKGLKQNGLINRVFGFFVVLCFLGFFASQHNFWNLSSQPILYEKDKML